MTKLIRNMSDARSRAFWAGVERSAAAIADKPAWMRAGIDLNPEHYETYQSEPSATPVAPTRRRAATTGAKKRSK